jgi:hypothetical protein
MIDLHGSGVAGSERVSQLPVVEARSTFCLVRAREGLNVERAARFMAGSGVGCVKSVRALRCVVRP